jgi:hypothetical protein
MKIPLICFLDTSLSEILTYHEDPQDFIWIGLCEYQDYPIVSSQVVKKKLFIEHKIYQIILRMSRERSTYPGILAGAFILSTFLNHPEANLNLKI